MLLIAVMFCSMHGLFMVFWTKYIRSKKEYEYFFIDLSALSYCWQIQPFACGLGCCVWYNRLVSLFALLLLVDNAAAHRQRLSGGRKDEKKLPESCVRTALWMRVFLVGACC